MFFARKQPILLLNLQESIIAMVTSAVLYEGDLFSIHVFADDLALAALYYLDAMVCLG